MIQWFKDLLRLKSKDKPVTANASEHEAIAVNGEHALEKGDLFVADSPIVDPALDRFMRWPFAQRVAQTIASRRDPSSIVIGIYGAWGEGKTTVLNFIEKELRESPHVVCVRFNPWRFGDEVHLLRNFFQTLADALGKSISSGKEEIGKWLQEYGGGLVPPITIDGVQVSPGESLKEIGRSLSSVKLDERRNRIEKVLKDEGKRVVVLMDDLDRLDKTEIQAVFKLVKLSADFAYTAYVLAFDDKMVAAALEEIYTSRNKEAGQSFLEKIVQVPLHLPRADELSLRKFCFEGVDEALSEAKIQLTEEQIKAFPQHFFDGLEIRLHTPRMAKRYCNALLFSLPILKGEVNPMDLMLIEGIRILYPKLYDVLRDNSDIFLGSLFDASVDGEQAKELSLQVINNGLEALTNNERKAAKNLLKVLFPRVRGVLGSTWYGHEWEDTWAKEQRVASKQYFTRFFSYTVPEGDISDQELESFLGRIENESISNIASEIQKLVGDRSAETFISKLRKREKKLSIEISRNLALAIAKIGNSFSHPDILFSSTTAFSQAGILVSNLVKNIAKGEDRFNIAKRIALHGQPISFAHECFRWMYSTEEEKEQDRTFSVEEENKLGNIIAKRIKELSQEKQPIYIHFPKDAPILLYAWSHWRSREETNQYLAGTVDEDSHNVLEFLKCHIPIQYGMESGISNKGDFRRDEYEAITRVVDANLIYNALHKIYGSDLDSPKYRDNGDRPFDEQVAHQFSEIYHHVKTEEQKVVEEKKEHETNRTEDGECS